MFHATRTLFIKRLQTVINKYERRKKQFLNAVFYPQVVKLVLNRPPRHSILARQSSYPSPHYQSLTADSTDDGGLSLSEFSPTKERVSVGSQLSCGGFVDSLGQRMQSQLSGKSQKLSFGQMSFASILQSDDDFQDFESPSQCKSSKRKRHKGKKHKAKKKKRKGGKEKQPFSGSLHSTPVFSVPDTPASSISVAGSQDTDAAHQSRIKSRRRVMVRINEIRAAISSTASKLSRYICHLHYVRCYVY